MLFDLPADDVLYQALLDRDPSFEGFAYVGVKSTGVFCKLTCAARKPKRENSLFYSSIAAALEAGFRPCKRCRPMCAGLTREPAIDRLLDALERAPEQKWSEQQIAGLGYDPSTIRRAFRRRFGITFLEIARLRRLGRGIEALADGAAVINAQVNADYASGSGFRNAIIKQLGVAPNKINHGAYLKADWIETPIGTMIAIADRDSLHLLEFLDRKALSGEIEHLKKNGCSAIVMGREAPIDRVEDELKRYFAGEPVNFTTPLATFGSAFTTRVWDALKTIPAGQVRSYSDIANLVGNGKATRAVARANGANQIAIVIPCHRVINANGDLGGYGGGLMRKEWLLKNENKTRSFIKKASY